MCTHFISCHQSVWRRIVCELAVTFPRQKVALYTTRFIAWGWLCSARVWRDIIIAPGAKFYLMSYAVLIPFETDTYYALQIKTSSSSSFEIIFG
jgi:hypothetical protein